MGRSSCRYEGVPGASLPLTHSSAHPQACANRPAAEYGNGVLPSANTLFRKIAQEHAGDDGRILLKSHRQLHVSLYKHPHQRFAE